MKNIILKYCTATVLVLSLILIVVLIPIILQWIDKVTGLPISWIACSGVTIYAIWHIGKNIEIKDKTTIKHCIKMKQEDKELLLKDLCARLPYGVKVKIPELQEDAIYEVYEISKDIITVKKENGSVFNVSYTIGIFPYLRPMSSMTKEELYKVQEILGKGVEIHDVFISIVDSSINTFSYLELQAVFDWLDVHHFDYRGLIEKGLALEAPEEMYNINEK